MGHLRKRRLHGSLKIPLPDRLVGLLRVCLLRSLESWKSLQVTFRLGIVRNFMHGLIGTDLRSPLVKIRLLVELEPIKTLHERNVCFGTGVLLVLQYLLKLPGIWLWNRLILRALNLVEARVRKIWREDCLGARIGHLGGLVWRECCRCGLFVHGRSQGRSTLVSTESEADLSAEVYNIFN